MPNMLKQSFVERLRVMRQTITPSDPWTAPLRNIRGQIGHDGVERTATDAVFEYLDIPRLKRTPDVAKRLDVGNVEMAGCRSGAGPLRYEQRSGKSSTRLRSDETTSPAAINRGRHHKTIEPLTCRATNYGHLRRHSAHLTQTTRMRTICREISLQ